MVIDDGDIGRAGIGPSKDDAPPIVDADGMVARAVAVKRFEPIARGHGEVGKALRSVYLHEFPQGHAGDGREAAVPFLLENLFGVGVVEGLDHGMTATVDLGVKISWAFRSVERYGKLRIRAG